MEFVNTADATRHAEGVLAILAPLFPFFIGKLISKYMRAELRERMLMQVLAYNHRGTHFNDSRYGFVSPRCADHEAIYWRCVMAPGLMTAQSPIRNHHWQCPIQRRSLWEFLCGAPSVIETKLMELIGIPEQIEHIRNNFRFSMVDFAVRDECAARARIRNGCDSNVQMCGYERAIRAWLR